MDMVIDFVFMLDKRGQLVAFKISHLRGIMCIPYDKYFLITIMEHWCDDTNTFHMLMGEMTITLIDIHHILWVPMKGTLIQWATSTMAKIEDQCY